MTQAPLSSLQPLAFEEISLLLSAKGPEPLLNQLDKLFKARFSADISIFTSLPELSDIHRPQKATAASLHELPPDSESVTTSYDASQGKYLVIAALKVGHQSLGSLISSRSDNSFTSLEQAEIAQIAQAAAVSLNTIYLSRSQEYQRKQLNLISEVTAQLAHITSFDELILEVCNLIHDTFGYYYVAVFLVTPDGRHAKLGASAGHDKKIGIPGLNLDIKTLVVGESIIGTVAATGEPLLANNVFSEPRYLASTSLPETQAELAIPLKIGKTILGVLDVQSNRRNAFSPSDEIVLTSLADGIALAINRVRLYENLEKRTDQLAVISEVSRSITSILNLDMLLKKVTDLLHEEFNYPYVHIFTYQNANNHLNYRAGSGARSEGFRSANISYDINKSKGILSTALCSREIQLVNDVSQDTRYIPNPITASNHGSELAIPLFIGENLLGVLDIQSDEANFFTESDIDLMTTLASSVSIAMRNANLYNSEQWRRSVAESLRDIAIKLSQNVSLDETVQDVFTKIEDVLPCDFAGLWLFDTNETEAEGFEPQLRLKWVKCFNKTWSGIKPGITALPGSWLLDAIQQDEPKILDKTSTLDPFKIVIGKDKAYSAVAAPLSTGGKKLGLLTLYHASKNRYGIETRNITLSFAGYAAVAIENDRLFQETRDQSWLSTISLQVASATRSLMSVEDLTELIGKLVMLLIGGKSGGILTFAPNEACFTLESVFGETNSSFLIKKLPVQLRGNPTLQKIIENQKPTAVPALEAGADVNELMNLQPDDTVLLFPLVAHNTLLGLLMQISSTPYIDSPPETVIGKRKYTILEAIAQQAALTLQNINLVNAKQDETYISRVLLHFSRTLSASSNLDEGLVQITNEVPVLTGAATFALVEESEDHQNLVIRYLSTDRIKPNIAARLIECSIPASAIPDLPEIAVQEYVIKPSNWWGFLKTQNPFHNSEDERAELPVNVKDDTRLIIVPLKTRGFNYGYMLVHDVKPTRQEQRVELFLGLAQQLSTALMNDHLKQIQSEQEKINREFSLAKQIQRTFLPEKLPEVKGYATAVRWQTALQVGGDFYDLFPLNEHQYGIVIADVSDKGLAASLYMTVSRTLIRATSLETTSPASTLEKVNHLLQIDSQQGFFVTTFYGVLDLQKHLLTYCNAGHNPPVFFKSSTHSIGQLRRCGIALGVVPTAKLIEHDLAFNHGDALYLFTDGVTEGFDPDGHFYGLERLIATFKEHATKTPDEILEKMITDQQLFRQNAAVSDDITQLIIKRD